MILWKALCSGNIRNDRVGYGPITSYRYDLPEKNPDGTWSTVPPQPHLVRSKFCAVGYHATELLDIWHWLGYSSTPCLCKVELNGVQKSEVLAKYIGTDIQILEAYWLTPKHLEDIALSIRDKLLSEIKLQYPRRRVLPRLLSLLGTGDAPSIRYWDLKYSPISGDLREHTLLVGMCNSTYNAERIEYLIELSKILSLSITNETMFDLIKPILEEAACPREA